MADRGVARILLRELEGLLGQETVPSVGDCIDSLLASRAWCDRTERNIRFRRARLGTLLAKRADTIGRAEGDALIADLVTAGYHARTINGTLDTLNQALSYAHECQRIGPPYHVRHVAVPPDEKPWLTWDDGQRLLDAASGATRIFVALCLRAGLRLGEALALQWADVRLVKGDEALTVRHTMGRRNGELGPPKGRKVVTVPMFPDLADMLREWHHLRGPWVVCWDDGRCWNRNRPEVAIREVLDTLDPPVLCADGTPYERRLVHTLRHSFCSHLVAKGMNLRDVQRFARHSSIVVTEGYAHCRQDDLRAAMERVGG